jgi:hypothetical protein
VESSSFWTALKHLSKLGNSSFAADMVGFIKAAVMANEVKTLRKDFCPSEVAQDSLVLIIFVQRW